MNNLGMIIYKKQIVFSVRELSQPTEVVFILNLCKNIYFLNLNLIFISEILTLVFTSLSFEK